MSTHVFVVIGLALMAVAVVFVLQQRRTPQSTAAWLLFILAVPYVALPIFLVLGFRKQGSRYPPIKFSDMSDGNPPVHPLDNAFRHFEVPGAVGGNSFQLLTTGETAFAAMMDVIAGANSRLQITFYLLSDDPVGRAFVEALTQRAQDGVEVRLILDRLGTLLRPKASLAALEAAGGHVQYFSPFLHAPDNGHLNLRNHRKLVIADGVRVFAGGMNVGGHYMGAAPDPDRFIDLAYDVSGPVVAQFCDIHQSDWGVAGGSLAEPENMAPPRNGDAQLQIVPSGPDMAEDQLHDALVYAIHAATRRVWITTPYFLPTEALGQALATAARRGIDVRIIVPRKSNQPVTDFARGGYLRELADAGCRIYFHETRMIHAKSGLIDDVGFVGSANFDVRSMLLNFETSLFVYDTTTVTALENWMDILMNACSEGVANPGFMRRIIEGVFRLGAPIL